MYIENFIHDFLEDLKLNLSEFKYLNEEIWSPSTDYDERLLTYVVENDLSNKLETKDWIGLVWTMTEIQAASTMGRPLEAIVKEIGTLTGEIYDLSIRPINFEVAAFSDEPHECVKFMEMFSIMYDRAYDFKVQYPAPLNFDLYPQGVTNISNAEFTKLDRDTRGSLTKFSFTFTAEIPFLRKKFEGPLIGEVTHPVTGNKHAKIWVNIGTTGQEVIETAESEGFILTPSFIII